MKKQWIVKQISETPNLPEYPLFVVKLLALRGLITEDAIKDHLNLDYGKLLSPFLFKQMQTSIDRIWQAIEGKELITIYADYDADAISAAAVVFLTLKKLGALTDVYIPDRFQEGYGVNLEAIAKIKEKGSSLIITVDCGTNSVEEAKLARELKIDMIITDHHEVTGEIPDSFSLINPKNPNDSYPYPYLTGVGVVYKLATALVASPKAKPLGLPPGWEKWLLDLVAIGTVADCQNLTLENRILVGFGIKVLEKTRWPGLRALLEEAGVVPPFDTFTLGFILAPRINAAGRLSTADTAFRLLVSDNILEAENLAKELGELNRHRQKLTEQILSEAKEQVEIIADKKVLMAAGEWPKGVVGLVAGRLAEEYGRPVLILERGELLATGSGRSTAGFDMVAALTFAKDLLKKYGGHTQAAGFTLDSQNIPRLHQRLLEYADNFYEVKEAKLEIDTEASALDLNLTNYSFIEKMAPFGIGNPKPRFVSYGLTVADLRTVGSNSQHLKLKLAFGDKIFGAIAFNKGFLVPGLSIGSKIDVVFELDLNKWNGRADLQLKILDLKSHE